MNFNPMMLLQMMPRFYNDTMRNNPNATPDELVRQKLQKGENNQMQFEEARRIANMLGFKV